MLRFNIILFPSKRTMLSFSWHVVPLDNFLKPVMGNEETMEGTEFELSFLKVQAYSLAWDIIILSALHLLLGPSKLSPLFRLHHLDNPSCPESLTWPSPLHNLLYPSLALVFTILKYETIPYHVFNMVILKLIFSSSTFH